MKVNQVNSLSFGTTKNNVSTSLIVCPLFKFSQLNTRLKIASLSGELLKTWMAFQDKPSTMRMVEVKTQILRPNICRYVAKLKKMGLIILIRTDYCPHTNHLAGFYSTNFHP